MKTSASRIKTVGTIVAFLGILITPSGVKAQAAYQLGDNVISVAAGFGTSYGAFTYGKQTPAFSLQYERGLWQAGPGVISLGGYLGYKSYQYSGSYFGFTYNEKWNYTIFGVRGAWHLQEFDGTELQKWDLYGGAMLGYFNLNYTYTDNDPNVDYNDINYSNSVGLSGFLGARYFFTPKLAAQGEIGYGISYLNLGLAYKF